MPQHIVVIGAGIWGAWTALLLQRSNKHVVLFDMWGPGNVRAGSGGHSRIIRLVYGADRLYTDLSARSFELWDTFFREYNASLYTQTGCLWLVSQTDDSYVRASIEHIEAHGHRLDHLSMHQAKQQYPQFRWSDVSTAYFEHRAGVLQAARCCRAVVCAFKEAGGIYREGYVSINEEAIGHSDFLQFQGQAVECDAVVIACGPWNRKHLPRLLGEHTYTSRQEIHYFSIPQTQPLQYSIPQCPAWIDLNARTPLYYGVPMHDGLGFKLAYDERTQRADPDAMERSPRADLIARGRSYLAHRFPELRAMPIVETKICQYENSRDGHFIVDRYPGQEDVILAGGSSGHGFKMGPAIGELITEAIVNDRPFPRLFAHDRFETSRDRKTQFQSE